LLKSALGAACGDEELASRIKQTRREEASMLRTFMAAALVVLGFGSPAAAQTYPDKPVRLVVPFAPGGGGGFVARVLADHLAEKWGQSVFIDNKPGAGSALGIDFVAKSKPDGYNMIFVTSDGVTFLPAVKPVMPYRVPEDFSYVAGLVTFCYGVAAYSKLPFKTMGEMIAYGKANPGKLRFASAGAGSGTHLTGELISRATGINMVHVPYNGAGPAIIGAVGGHVDLVLVTPSVIKPQVDAGALVALAVTDKDRHPNLPEAQTMIEAGMPDLTVTGYYGILAPAGTPEPILEKWRKGLEEALHDPKVAERMVQLGFVRAFLPGDQFRDFLVKDLERWKAVAKAANISLPD
jgi:tripartite-type tricarboxylate transporter receptor subunit TctC